MGLYLQRHEQETCGIFEDHPYTAEAMTTRKGVELYFFSGSSRPILVHNRHREYSTTNRSFSEPPSLKGHRLV